MNECVNVMLHTFFCNVSTTALTAYCCVTISGSGSGPVYSTSTNLAFIKYNVDKCWYFKTCIDQQIDSLQCLLKWLSTGVELEMEDETITVMRYFSQKHVQSSFSLLP